MQRAHNFILGGRFTGTVACIAIIGVNVFSHGTSSRGASFQPDPSHSCG
jgi:hypothetical protein